MKQLNNYKKHLIEKLSVFFVLNYIVLTYQSNDFFNKIIYKIKNKSGGKDE